MTSAFEYLQQLAYRWTIKYNDDPFIYHEIEAGGQGFEEFLNWLKKMPYDKELPELLRKEEPKDEGISW